MGTAKRVLRNTLLLYSSEILSKVFSFFVMVLVARKLGSIELGRLTYVGSLIGLAGVITDWGFTTLATKKITQNEGRASEIAGIVLVLRVCLSALTWAFLVFYSSYLEPSHEISSLMRVWGVTLFPNAVSSTAASLLRARERLQYEATAKTGCAVAHLFLCYGVIAWGYGIQAIVLVSVLLSFLTALYFSSQDLRVDLSQVRRVLSLSLLTRFVVEAFPFAALSLCVTVYFRIDAMMLQFMKGPGEVGQYAAAYRILEGILLIPWVFSISLFPLVSKYFSSSRELLIHSTQLSVKYLSFLAVPIVVWGTLFGHEVILWVYGRPYEDAVFAFQILTWAIVPVFLSSVTSTLINASQTPAVNTYIAALMVIENISLNLAWIPSYGLYGASVATVITELTGLIIGTLYIRRAIYRAHFLPCLIRPLASSMAMAVVVTVFKNIYFIPVYILVYILIFHLLGGWDKDDREFFSSVLLRGASPGV